jgi:hypothetical protein
MGTMDMELAVYAFFSNDVPILVHHSAIQVCDQYAAGYRGELV